MLRGMEARGWMVNDATSTFSTRLQTMIEEIISGYMATVVSTEEMIKMITGKKQFAGKHTLSTFNTLGVQEFQLRK